MIRAGVRLDNIEGFDAQLEEVVAAIDANLETVATAVYTEAKATSLFADKTGRLRISIRKRKSKYNDGGYIVMASGGTRAEGNHAHLVEFGHVMLNKFGAPTKLSRVPARPFLRKATEHGISLAISLFRNNK